MTLIQPRWSAYPYHLVFLIWYPYSLVFLIWYPYAPTSLYSKTAHCSGYGVAMGCYGLFIVTRTAIVTSQWYDRYCFTEYARTWARHPTTPWQREFMAITDRQSIDSLLDSMRFVTHFWEITPYILRGAIVVLVQYQCYSINARAFGPRTPYRVGGLAGDVMRAWASHSFGKSLDLYFRSFTIVSFTIYLYWIKGILRGYAIRSGRRTSGSQRPGRRTCGPPCGRWLPSGRLPDRIA